MTLINACRAKGIALSIGVIAVTDLVYLQVAAQVSSDYGVTHSTKYQLTSISGFSKHWLEVLSRLHHPVWFGINLRLGLSPRNQEYSIGRDGQVVW